jgi:hypothetical protein
VNVTDLVTQTTAKDSYFTTTVDDELYTPVNHTPTRAIPQDVLQARSVAGHLRSAVDHLELPSDLSPDSEMPTQLSAWSIHALKT